MKNGKISCLCLYYIKRSVFCQCLCLDVGSELLFGKNEGVAIEVGGVKVGLVDEGNGVAKRRGYGEDALWVGGA